jgi:hypothetical protein
MRKIWFIIFISVLVLNSAIGGSVLAVNGKYQTENTSSANNEEYIPTLLDFTIRGRSTKSGFDFESQFPKPEIHNWTASTQQVRIQWEIINDYNYSTTITLFIRIAEWQYKYDKGLQLVTRFLWWYERGNINLPDFPLIFHDFPKFFNLKITMNPNEHSTNSTIVNIEFPTWTPGDHIQYYCAAYCRQALLFPPAKGGLDIYVP